MAAPRPQEPTDSLPSRGQRASAVEPRAQVSSILRGPHIYKLFKCIKQKKKRSFLRPLIPSRTRYLLPPREKAAASPLATWEGREAARGSRPGRSPPARATTASGSLLPAALLCAEGGWAKQLRGSLWTWAGLPGVKTQGDASFTQGCTRGWAGLTSTLKCIC